MTHADRRNAVAAALQTIIGNAAPAEQGKLAQALEDYAAGAGRKVWKQITAENIPAIHTTIFDVLIESTDAGVDEAIAMGLDGLKMNRG